MSKERARRRAERLAVLEREKASRARRVARRARRRDLMRRLTPKRRGRTGRLLPRRSRAERAGIGVAIMLAALAIWYFVDNPALRLILGTMLLLGLPVLVVITLGRRNR